jgi:hypothetical protein
MVAPVGGKRSRPVVQDLKYADDNPPTMTNRPPTSILSPNGGRKQMALNAVGDALPDMPLFVEP